VSAKAIQDQIPVNFSKQICGAAMMGAFAGYDDSKQEGDGTMKKEA